MRRLLSVLCLLASVFWTGGCATAPTVKIERAPEWRAPADTSIVTEWQVRAELGSVLPGVPVYFSDAAYSRVSHVWLEEMIPWSWRTQMALGFIFKANTRDCDKFSLGLFLAATNAAANAGLEATPLFARLVVSQEHDFAGVPGARNTRHGLNGIYTDRPPHFWILEPQASGSGRPRLVPLAEYPNRILSVVLGDYNPPAAFVF